MKKVYETPIAEVIEFDTVDVITTSGDLDVIAGDVASANQDAGWTGLY